PLAVSSVPALEPPATPTHHRHHHALIPSTPATATADLQKNTASVAKPTKHIGRSQRAHGKVATQPVLTPHGGGVKLHKHAVKPAPKPPAPDPGRTQVQTDPTVVNGAGGSTGGSGASTYPADPGSGGSGSTGGQDPSGTP
ncbi:MAG: hypothetical protein JOZ73_04960, partial [Solirubrobacterales bacterium]|nr:hypothetical protein [Solirubrobacterales bacterium]